MDPIDTVQTLACMLMRYRLLLKEKGEQQRGVYGGDGSTAGLLDVKTLASMNDRVNSSWLSEGGASSYPGVDGYHGDTSSVYANHGNSSWR